MADKTGNTAGAGAGGDLGELNKEQDSNGDELLSGQEQDDDSGEGAEGVGADEEGGDAGGEEVAAADDEEEVEGEEEEPPPPPPTKGKAKAATAPSAKAEAEAEPDVADDPELAKLTSEMTEVEKRGRETTGRAQQIRQFMKGQIKLTDGTAYADLDEAERIEWQTEYADVLRASKEAAREFARVKATHAAKAAEVAEARTFGRVSASILGNIESIVSKIDGLTEGQKDAARGFILRKAQGANAVAFFNRPLAEVEGDIRKQVGGRRGSADKRTTAVLSAKKAPSSILPNKTSGGRGDAAAAKGAGGFTQSELNVLRSTHRTTYNRVMSGAATPQEIARIKTILKE